MGTPGDPSEAPTGELGIEERRAPLDFEAEREAGTEAAQADEQAEQPPEPFWRNAQELGEITDHEEFRPWLDEHDEEREHQLRTELGRRNRQMADQFSGLTGAVMQTSQSLVQDIADLVEALNAADEPTKRRLGTQVNSALDRLSQQFVSAQGWAFSRRALESFFEQIEPGFFSSYEAEIMDAINSQGSDYRRADQQFEDIAKRLMRQHEKRIRAEAIKSNNDREGARRDRETKQLERERQRAPATVRGGTGPTRSLDDVLTNENATQEDRDRAFRQKHGIPLPRRTY